MARVFMFPGQGSQTVGMGLALAEAFPAAREVFEEVDDALMAHSLAMMRVLEREAGVDLGDAMFVAGHSLGEYSALCAAGALPLSATARLLRLRGEAMQAAVPPGEGAMAALIGVDLEGAEKAVAATPGEGVLEIANDNAPGQVVVSGSKARVEALAANAKSHGIKMAKLLPVSAPFHCSLMAPAAEAMAGALAKAPLKAPKTPLVANVTAAPTDRPDEIRDLLVRQVTGRVRWTESVRFMADGGATRFIEVGSGKVLAGLVKRIAADAAAISVGEPSDIDAFMKF